MSELISRVAETDFYADFDISSDTTTDILTVLKAKFTSDAEYKIALWINDADYSGTQTYVLELYTNTTELVQVPILTTQLDAAATTDHYMGGFSFSKYYEVDWIDTNIIVKLTTANSGDIDGYVQITATY